MTQLERILYTLAHMVRDANPWSYEYHVQCAAKEIRDALKWQIETDGRIRLAPDGTEKTAIDIKTLREIIDQL